MTLREPPNANGTYEVIAVRYGERDTTKSESLYRYHVYGEPDETFAMAYYFWLVRGGGETLVVDSGFKPAAGERRGRPCSVAPADALARLGVDPLTVSKVFVSHMHYDHIGNLDLFPNATLLVDAHEIDFWTSEMGRRGQFALSAEQPEIAYIAQAGRQGRVQSLGPDQDLMPGVRSLRVGGHTPGQQILLVRTAGGQVVLASDALHFYEELEADRPFAVFTDLPTMYRTYDVLREIAQEPSTSIIAGHDAAVFHDHPAVAGPDGEIAVRLG